MREVGRSGAGAEADPAGAAVDDLSADNRTIDVDGMLPVRHCDDHVVWANVLHGIRLLLVGSDASDRRSGRNSRHATVRPPLDSAAQVPTDVLYNMAFRPTAPTAFGTAASRSAYVPGTFSGVSLSSARSVDV